MSNDKLTDDKPLEEVVLQSITGHQLRERRKAAGLTTGETALRLGVTPSIYSRWEARRSKQIPITSYVTYIKNCEFLNVIPKSDGARQEYSNVVEELRLKYGLRDGMISELTGVLRVTLHNVVNGITKGDGKAIAPCNLLLSILNSIAALNPAMNAKAIGYAVYLKKTDPENSLVALVKWP